MYFSKHKLAIEVDEKGHTGRDEKIKEELGCYFVKINPDKNDYDEYFEFGKICNRGNESNKKSTEESPKNYLIDKISKMLIRIESKQNNSIK